ncbi:hypothetical protein LY76DRAFT_606635 [Colletotrichum caudatum]|nr:hypothetical protein LY76DRAFT_606635 [Colletotrichum caudatum]
MHIQILERFQIILVPMIKQVALASILPNFSLNFNNCNVHGLPAFFKKDSNYRHFIQKCEETGMAWSVICNGPFLDRNLRSGFMDIDIYENGANYFNDGNNVHA